MARIQIGIIAYRKPNGDFLPAIPIYRDVATERPIEELLPIDELAEIFADKFKAYKAAQCCKKAAEAT